jgi:hypothetical protein
MVYRITFLTAFLRGMEIRFLLTVLLKPTTITSVVRGIRASMLLAQVAMLLKANFLGHPDRSLGTRAFFPFLALVRRLLGRFQFALFVGADAFDCFQQSEKQAHVHWHHALLIHRLYWSCHWRGHIRSTWLPSSASVNGTFSGLVLAFALGL